MRRFVLWEDVEELTSVVHRKREDQPIWFGGSERGLYGSSCRAPIAQREVRSASQPNRGAAIM